MEEQINSVIMKSTLLLLIAFFIVSQSYSQSRSNFCKATSNSNFKKVERDLKRKIYKLQKGVNLLAIKSEINYTQTFDSLLLWFKSYDCVKDVMWDKCQEKILIYPGSSIIGVIFRTNSGEVEKCFTVQLGTTGQINIFGWHPKISKSKNKLVYKQMRECSGFVKEQQRLCLQK